MKRVAPIRFVLIALVALAFGIASIAAAQQGTSVPRNGYNGATHVIGSYGTTIDQVEFELENVLAMHRYGNFRPDAYIRVAIPLQNNTNRAIECSVVNHPSSSGEIGRRLTEVIPGSNITIGANGSGSLLYFLQFAAEDQWLPTDFGQTTAVHVRVNCTGILPAIQNTSH